MIKTLVEAREGRVTITVTADSEVSAEVIQPSELDWAAVRAERDRLKDRVVRMAQRIAVLEADEALDVAEARVKELEAELATAKESSSDGLLSNAQVISEIARDRRIRELEQKVQEYDRDRHTEQKRADQNKAWAIREQDRAGTFWNRVKELEAELAEERHRVQARGEVIEELGGEVRKQEGRAATLSNELEKRCNEREDQRRRADKAEQSVTELTAQLGKVSGAVLGPAVLSALGSDWRSWTETEAVAVANAVRDARRVLNLPLA